MSERILTTDEWLQIANQFYERFSGPVTYLDLSPHDVAAEKMELKSHEEIEANPIEALQYYSSWMATFSSQVYFWRCVVDFLERRYKNLCNQGTLSDAKVTETRKKAMAQFKWENLDTACVIARTQYQKSSTNFQTAETYRDMVSRSVTAREAERKVTRQW